MDPIVNAREPRGKEGERFLEHMNEGHEEMARWGTSKIAIAKDHDVLDIGCGGGRNLEFFLEACPYGTVTGVDRSELSVEFSKEKNRDAVSKGRCRVLNADVSSLPFEPLSFDIATAFETVYYWPSITDSFREVLRVLRRGGTFMICNEADRLDERTQGWVDRIGHGMRIYDAEQLEGHLKEAGFTGIKVFGIPERHWLCVTAKRPYEDVTV
ncbi:MAG: class I SAM-dependent methyltransferase [Candidatus Methanomethylophilaceae archaeon]